MIRAGGAVRYQKDWKARGSWRKWLPASVTCSSRLLLTTFVHTHVGISLRSQGCGFGTLDHGTVNLPSAGALIWARLGWPSTLFIENRSPILVIARWM